MKTSVNILRGLLLSALVLSATAQAENFRLFVGQMKTLKLESIERVAVGNGSLISTSILKDGSLLVLGEKAGDTEMNVWLQDGTVVSHRFYVTGGNSARGASEIRAILGRVKGLSVRQIGSNIVLKGSISHKTSAAIQKVMAVYSNVIDLTEPNANSDLSSVFKDMPQLKVRKAGDKVVVTGAVTQEEKDYIAAVSGSYPELVDLTSTEAANPMVSMNVQITEFGNNAAEKLGINWSSIAGGPRIKFDTIGGADSRGDGGVDVDVGIVGSIEGAINFAIDSGDAIMLASPTLSALSGSEAEFLAGGEFPVSVPGGINGNTIEFKQYGIILKVKPEVSSGGRIIATIETEVSSLDDSVTVAGVPGLKTRKTTTEVSLKQGETFAISGLVNRDVSKSTTRMPFFSKIPVLGQLFKSKNFINKRSDLIIFITPNIVNPASAQNQAQLAKAEHMRQQFIENTNLPLEILD